MGQNQATVRQLLAQAAATDSVELAREKYETAYALACDVAAADGKLDQPELQFLQETRYQLTIDRLHAAAIERGSRARHLVI